MKIKYIICIIVAMCAIFLICEQKVEANEVQIADGVYSIKSAKDTKYVLDITAVSNNELANVEIWSNHGGNNQKYEITNVEDGYYKIKAMNSGKFVSVESLSTEPGANVNQQSYNGGANQLWKIIKTEDGYYKFISKNSGLCIDIFGGKMNDGTNVIVWTEHDKPNQRFRLELCNDDANSSSNSNNNSQNEDVTNSENLAEAINFDDGVYLIKSSKNTKYVLNIANNSNNESANVEICSNHGEKNQKFEITNVEDGYYKIKAMNSGKYISVESSSKVPGVNVNQQTYNGGANQLWKIIKTEDGYYKFISKNSGLCIDIFGGNMNDGTNVIVWTEHDKPNQRFELDPCNDDDNSNSNSNNNSQNENVVNNEDSNETIDKYFPDGIYSIVSTKDQKFVLDITASSNDDFANVEIWTNHRGKNQRFDIAYVGDGYYKIKAINSGKYISVEENNTEPGANIIQQTYSGNSNQLWKITKTEDGYYKFVSKYNGLCIDIFGGMMNNGTNVIMWTEHDKLNQKFRLDPYFDNNISSGTYKIASATDDKYVLDVEARSNNDGANIELWSDHGGNNQKFYFNDLGKGYYTIYSINSKKYLDVENGSISNGANIIQYRKTGKESQQWFLKPVGNGNYYLINCNGMYMGTDDYTVGEGTNIVAWSYNHDKIQEFKLVPTTPNIIATGRSAEFKRNHPDIQIGVDVSYFQGTIDWNAVKNDGVDYAIVRAGFRGYGESGSLNEDSTFARNVIGARNAGLDVGVYFFSQARNYEEGVREAMFTLDLIKKYDITYPIAFDTEASSSPNNTGRADNISVQARTDAARGFCETIEKAGYKSLIYASPSWLQNKLDLSQLSEYKVWLANYTGATQENPLNRPSSYRGDYVMWQYTSTGSVNGINGNVDCNIYYYLRDN